MDRFAIRKTAITRVLWHINGANGQVVEQNDYYAFGAKHINSTLAISPTNRFKYNGKEMQNTGDLKFLDYGARMYDPALGRWFCIDPLVEKYYPFSPYITDTLH